MTALAQKEKQIMLALAALALVFAMSPMSMDWIDTHDNYPANDCGHNWFFQISRHVTDSGGPICGVVSQEELARRMEEKLRKSGMSDEEITAWIKQGAGPTPDNPIERAFLKVLDELAASFRAGGK